MHKGLVSLVNAASLSYVLCGCVFQVVDVTKRISDVPEWFKGARLNYAENLLKHADQDKVALYAASEWESCVSARGERQSLMAVGLLWVALLKPPHTPGGFRHAQFLLFFSCCLTLMRLRSVV